jgi:hypothetical protein
MAAKLLGEREVKERDTKKIGGSECRTRGHEAGELQFSCFLVARAVGAERVGAFPFALDTMDKMVIPHFETAIPSSCRHTHTSNRPFDQFFRA